MCLGRRDSLRRVARRNPRPRGLLRPPHPGWSERFVRARFRRAPFPVNEPLRGPLRFNGSAAGATGLDRARTARGAVGSARTPRSASASRREATPTTSWSCPCNDGSRLPDTRPESQQEPGRGSRQPGSPPRGQATEPPDELKSFSDVPSPDVGTARTGPLDSGLGCAGELPRPPNRFIRSGRPGVTGGRCRSPQRGTDRS